MITSGTGLKFLADRSNALTLVDTVLNGTELLYIDGSTLTGTNALTLNASGEFDATTTLA